jgi:PilZ domain
LLKRAEAQDRRRHRRVQWAVRVRGLTGDGQEFSAMTVDVCAGGLRINLARPLEVGDNLVLYLDEIGRVEGVVARALEVGYAVEFKLTPRKRDKIADQLTWLINRDRLGLSDEREAERRVAGGQVVATYSNGVSIACAVMDVSIFGVALKTTGPRPMIGDKVTVGERSGTCVRYIEGGFAVDFRTMHATE